jgi:peptide chain release factor 2
LKELETIELEPNFWSDQKKAQSLLKEKTTLEGTLSKFKTISSGIEDGQALLELVAEDQSPDNLLEATEEFKKLEHNTRGLEVQEMLGGQNDRADAIVNINAGAGGTEAQDWAQILMRMYVRFCENQNWKVNIVDTLPGEEAGIKSATFTVTGEYAYGMLAAEIGVHRLVRISPFDSNARRHTSFASVFVYPDIEQEIEIEVLDKDIRVDTYRAGGAGGQKVNKTDSAVRLTHLATGIVVCCQNERSQHQNRAMAMKILKARLYEHEMAQKMAEKKVLEDSKMDIAWGSQIRSYVLAPYRMAKDHRTDHEVGDVMSVLDGELSGFIEAFLIQKGVKS